jgi:hypothetical protein
MFKGTVSFIARFKGNGLTFPAVEFDPSEPGVEKVEIERPNGEELLSTVHLRSVATPDEGRAIAAKVITTALDRITFRYLATIETARISGDSISPINPQPGGTLVCCGQAVVSCSATLTASVPAAALKTVLEQPSPPGERYYALLRTARQSGSPVEEYLHLYHLLLMLHDDRQSNVDEFIVDQDPSVPRTQHPKKKAGEMETIYSRLRNEFAHPERGVDIEKTKSEMGACLGKLLTLTRQAIESKS